MRMMLKWSYVLHRSVGKVDCSILSIHQKFIFTSIISRKFSLFDFTPQSKPLISVSKTIHTPYAKLINHWIGDIGNDECRKYLVWFSHLRVDAHVETINVGRRMDHLNWSSKKVHMSNSTRLPNASPSYPMNIKQNWTNHCPGSDNTFPVLIFAPKSSCRVISINLQSSQYPGVAQASPSRVFKKIRKRLSQGPFLAPVGPL